MSTVLVVVLVEHLLQLIIFDFRDPLQALARRDAGTSLEFFEAATSLEYAVHTIESLQLFQLFVFVLIILENRHLDQIIQFADALEYILRTLQNYD